MRPFLFACVALLVASCAACQRPAPPGPGPVVDASAERAEPITCAAYCAHLRELGCPSGNPTPGGASCEAVCDNVQNGGGATLNLACRVHAPSCAASDACQ